MRGDSISFSHLLPIIDLALLVVLVFVPITLMAVHLYQTSAGSSQVHIHTDQSEMTLPRSQIVPWAVRATTVSKAKTTMAIDLPGFLIQWLISLPSRSSLPSGWHPQALMLDTWRTLVFPFFALPFWWVVGCGLDCLLSKERMHWSLLLIGTMFFGVLLAAMVSHCFPMSTSDRSDSVWVMKGAIAWAIAFAVLPIAWITQSIRQHRHSPAEL